jgi:GR25 family glycosyltransferase involved in LPS biosynthesis
MLDKLLKIFNEIFDITYVLTIPRAKDRQSSIKSQFGKCNYEFHFGLDAREQNIDILIKKGILDVDASKKNKPDKSSLSIGEFACSWGHARIYDKIIKNDYSHVLILEDDAIFNNMQLSELLKIIDSIPADADLIYWGYDRSVKYKSGLSRLLKYFYHIKLIFIHLLFSKKRNGLYIQGFPVIDHAMIENMYTKPYNKYFSRAGAHYSTHAYSITKSAAEKLANLQNPISHVADFLLIYAILHNHIKAYIINEPLFIQDKYQTLPCLNQYLDR